MKNSTKKKKGSDFEKFVCKIINEQLDLTARRTSASGAGLDKGDIYSPKQGWIIECKNHRNLNISTWLGQMTRQGDGINRPVLVFKDPKSPDINPEPYAVLSLYDLIGIAKNKSEIVLEEKADNRDLKWAIENLLSAVKKVNKILKIE